MRKRVIKLLKSFYDVNYDIGRRVDISTRLVLRMMDEDDTVKDLTTKTMEELWFRDSSPLPQKPNTESHNTSLSKVAVIVGVSANFKDRQSPLEEMLHNIMSGKTGTEATVLHSRYAKICETLIDGLVDASDMPGFVRAVCFDFCCCVHELVICRLS